MYPGFTGFRFMGAHSVVEPHFYMVRFNGQVLVLDYTVLETNFSIKNNGSLLKWELFLLKNNWNIFNFTEELTTSLTLGNVAHI